MILCHTHNAGRAIYIATLTCGPATNLNKMADAAVPAAETKASSEIKDLLPLLDKRGLECLNQDSKHPITHAVEEVLALSHLADI